MPEDPWSVQTLARVGERLARGAPDALSHLSAGVEWPGLLGGAGEPLEIRERDPRQLEHSLHLLEMGRICFRRGKRERGMQHLAA